MPYYVSLPTLRVDQALKTDAPTLASIKKFLGEPQALIIISIAINEICEFVNVGQRMSPGQVALAARHILERFWYFKPEDIKACFYARLTTEKIYTFDASMLLRWLGEYDLERDNACEDDAVNGKEADRNEGAISHAVYLNMLKVKAEQGDEQSRQILSQYQRRGLIRTPEEVARKEQEFRLFKHRYLKSKQKTDNNE